MAEPSPADPSSATLLDTGGGTNGSSRKASVLEIGCLGCGLIVLYLLLIYLLASVWPADCRKGEVCACSEAVHFLWMNQVLLQDGCSDTRLLMLVMLAGGLGSFIHTATSFADFVGNEKLTRSWIWWYLLKPFIGMALAVIFYVVVRGGFISPGAGAEDLNRYGIAALAGLAGMFSKQATDKLSEVFTTLFRTAPEGGDAKRKDDLANQVPTLSAVEPNTLVVAATNLDVVVRGANFVRSSLVSINGTSRRTVFGDDSRLTVTLTPDDVVSDRTLDLVVTNPPPGGGDSAKLPLRVVSGGSTGGGAAAQSYPKPDEGVDGCDVEILDATPDESLPTARGGVSTP